MGREYGIHWEKMNSYVVCWGRQKGKDHWEDIDVGFRVYDAVIWTGLTWLRIGTNGGLL
jgi:hypothetical protein